MERMIPVIDAIAERKCEKFLVQREFESGINGPYHDPETPLRVLAHWITIFHYEYKKTKKQKYLELIRVLADEICSHQEKNGTFLVRLKEGKDKVNGTIGMAWIAQGLIEAARALSEDSYYSAAARAYFSQPFDEKIGQYLSREYTGEILGRDVSYNHQLWLAAAGAEINDYRKNARIQRDISLFLDNSKRIFRTYKSGLIHHHVYNFEPSILWLKSIKKYYSQGVLNALGKAHYQYKEEGYHYFNMYGFALLRQYYGDHVFFHSKSFLNALSYTLDFTHAFGLTENQARLDSTGMAQKIPCECNIFGFGYNSPAFELPYILKVFVGENYRDSYGEMLDELMEKQFQLTYDSERKSFCHNTEDVPTLEARMYEFVRSL